jgi:hypothetical protein
MSSEQGEQVNLQIDCIVRQRRRMPPSTDSGIPFVDALRARVMR